MTGLRQDDRIEVGTLCAEYVGEKERYGIVVDVSENGLRLQRPLGGGRAGSIVQLEFELPEVDEVIWAKGQVCFGGIL